MGVDNPLLNIMRSYILLSVIRLKPIRHDIKPLFTTLSGKLEEDGSILFAYIFGSYGRGTPGPLGDVDLALYLDEALCKNAI
jgi:hypothetical protein